MPEARALQASPKEGRTLLWFPGHLKYLRVLWSSTCKHPRPSVDLSLGASPPQCNCEWEGRTKEAGTQVSRFVCVRPVRGLDAKGQNQVAYWGLLLIENHFYPGVCSSVVSSILEILLLVQAFRSKWVPFAWVLLLRLSLFSEGRCCVPLSSSCCDKTFSLTLQLGRLGVGGGRAEVRSIAVGSIKVSETKRKPEIFFER